MTIQTAEEVADRSRPDVIAEAIPLGLNVHSVQSQWVLVNHPVNPVIAGAAECAPCILA